MSQQSYSRFTTWMLHRVLTKLEHGVKPTLYEIYQAGLCDGCCGCGYTLEKDEREHVCAMCDGSGLGLQ